MTPSHELSRRERQIMDVIYRQDRATAAEVRDGLPDPPSYSAVRALLRVLEDKGHLRHEQDGPRYAYLPTVPRESARTSAMQRLVRTFFGGSPERAMVALLESDDLDDEALERIAERIRAARDEE